MAQPVRKAARKTGATPAKSAGAKKKTAVRAVAVRTTAKGGSRTSSKAPKRAATSRAAAKKSAPSRKAGAGTPLDHMRQICLSLPDTRETLTWGEPHFRVGDKIFAGCGMEKGRAVIGFKLEMDHADAIIGDPRFRRAPYVGHKGWVSMDANQVTDWDEVRPLVLESYRLIAPKRSFAKLGDAASHTLRAIPGRSSRRR